MSKEQVRQYMEERRKSGLPPPSLEEMKKLWRAS